MNEASSQPLPQLRDVPGPVAYGGDPQRFRELLWQFSLTEFKAQYARTSLGFLWSLIRPLFFFGVIFLVLREILRFGADIPDYGLILILSLILFTYFQDATSRSVRAAASREAVIRSTEFPRVIIPLSVSLTAAFTLILNLLSVLPLAIAYGLRPHLGWLWFGFAILALIVLTTAVCLLLSALFVRSADIAQAWGLISRTLFYASPVLFPIDAVPGSYQEVVAATPLAPILEQARVWVIDPSAPNGVDEVGLLFGAIVPLIGFVVLCVAGVRLFAKEAPRVAERL